MTGLRVLVCGGRDYADRSYVWGALSAVAALHGVACVIHGAQRGADSLGGEWARYRGVEEIAEPADWKGYGKMAGPRRNAKMLRDHAPDLVLAFPGGRGTADMVAKAMGADVRVVEL